MTVVPYLTRRRLIEQTVGALKGLGVVPTMTHASDNRLDANAVLQSLHGIGQAEACEIPGTLHYRVSSNGQSFFLPYDNAYSHSSSIYLAPQIHEVLENNVAYVCAHRRANGALLTSKDSCTCAV